MLRETRKKELKERIFLRALELFEQKGYDSVTVEEIAAASGIAKGTFFNYFPRKEHVLLHLGESQSAQLAEIVGRHRDADLKLRLRNIFRELLGFYSRHFELLKLALSESLRSALVMKEESANIRNLQETLVRIVDEAEESGHFRNRQEPRVIASVLTAIYFNTLIAWSLQEFPDEALASLFERQLDAVWEGIGNGEGEKRG